MPKVRETNLRMTPGLQEQIIEVHPEVCLWAMNDRSPMKHRKTRVVGRSERLDLLARAFDCDFKAAFESIRSKLERIQDVKRDDFLDACAAAWTAARYARGEHGTLPPDPPTDRRGLRMEIVY